MARAVRSGVKTQAPAREPLGRERIVSAALDLIEEAGLAAFSTRKLAAKLGCEAMSIYYYFPSKEHLMDALIDRVIGDELSVLTPGDGPWRAQLERSAWEWRRMALRHPSFFSYLALHRMNTPTGLRWLDGIIGVIAGVGLREEIAVRLFRDIGYFLIGAMLEETAGYSKGGSTIAPVPDDVLKREYPHVHAAGRWFAEPERQKTWELGLTLLLDGVERLVAQQSGA
ncbi:MAG TPA: TetR/AcrR family transcriptional regulator C-terminal domain-containing protein [Bryobacteraceae bacterium]|nr:TetR/AcrR family transcriptional regulator C-terminal domain-containing protein [Bryobacteraceae bacterium]